MTDTLRFYGDPFGDTRWRVEAPNGEPTLASTEGYVKVSDALANAKRYLLLSPTEDPNVWAVHTTESTAPTGIVTESVEALAEALAAWLCMEKHGADERNYCVNCLSHAKHIGIPTAIASGAVRPAAEVRAQRDKGLADYLAQMDRAGGGIYTSDFREGFRHALAMLAAYESDEESSPDRVRPEVREAARLALSRRPAPCCPGARSMAHVRSCVNHPEADRG